MSIRTKEYNRERYLRIKDKLKAERDVQKEGSGKKFHKMCQEAFIGVDSEGTEGEPL